MMRTFEQVIDVEKVSQEMKKVSEYLIQIQDMINKLGEYGIQVTLKFDTSNFRLQ